jgi:cytochrome c oxidase cbb3-type subunit 3
LFAITIGFGICYAVYFPSLPNYKGLSGWSQEKQYENQVNVEEERYAPLRAEAQRKALEALASLSSDPATVQAGREVFTVRCSPCHGDNAEGRVGPSLIDAEWRYGSEPKDILESIREGRPKGMPPWKVELQPEDIQSVTAYVISLKSNSEEDK